MPSFSITFTTAVTPTEYLPFPVCSIWNEQFVRSTHASGMCKFGGGGSYIVRCNVYHGRTPAIEPKYLVRKLNCLPTFHIGKASCSKKWEKNMRKRRNCEGEGFFHSLPAEPGLVARCSLPSFCWRSSRMAFLSSWRNSWRPKTWVSDWPGELFSFGATSISLDRNIVFLSVATDTKGVIVIKKKVVVATTK